MIRKSVAKPLLRHLEGFRELTEYECGRAQIAIEWVARSQKPVAEIGGRPIKRFFPLGEGDVTLTFSRGLSVAGCEELAGYIEMFLKGVKRGAEARERLRNSRKAR